MLISQMIDSILYGCLVAFGLENMGYFLICSYLYAIYSYYVDGHIDICL
jgi:hypothetical protein